MYPFIETIRIEQGKACNLSYHNERLNNTLHHFWPDCAGIELGEYLKLTPEMNGMKCRVIYDGSGIKEISYEAYQMRPVHSLQLVYSDDIDYTYKSTDREALNRLFACRGERDDILIVRRGLLTDTSIANIALFDGKDWFTPKLPLLRGTCRTALIDNGIIKEKDIRPEELSSYSFVRLFNAMIKWERWNFLPEPFTDNKKEGGILKIFVCFLK